ncbi:MAG: dTDP-4-dehydrorhamnose 3,5-epimerase [Planctomycetes bacterium]|nr:dTDP-4-dehydrorhamnose 3,5-epimerase [Planctomycetota bacterium]
MKFSQTKLNGAWIIEPEPFHDHRGKFVRLFCRSRLKEILQGNLIEQVNYSLTIKTGAVRGMHFQSPPKAEIKLVRCLKGVVFDVMVDLRRRSPTFLQWHGEILSEENMKMLYVPKGFAHGFQTMQENCEMLYLHTDSYSPQDEAGLRYDEPMVGIQWPHEVVDISDKDNNFPLLTSEFAGINL